MPTFYQEIEHTADWSIRVVASDLDGLFEQAAQAMFELQGAPLAVEPTLHLEVACQGIDLETLLVAWLSELLYLSEMNNALFTRFAVRLARDDGTSAHVKESHEDGGELLLTARVGGVPGRGQLAHVKAVTYYRLAVIPTDGGWQATITFDT